MAGWRHRIIRSEEHVDPSQLLANPFNARVHSQKQQSAMSDTLDKVGWVARLLVNDRTGHMLNGHMRAALAISEEETVPVDYVDLDEDEERIVLASFDALGMLATIDRKAYDELCLDLPPLSQHLFTALEEVAQRFTTGLPDGYENLARDMQDERERDGSYDSGHNDQLRKVLLLYSEEDWAEIHPMMRWAREHYQVDTNAEAMTSALRDAYSARSTR